MGKRLLLDVDPLTGIRHEVDIDADGDGFTAVEFQSDLIEQSVLDSNARLRSLYQNKKANFQHAARIPRLTWELWRKEWAAGPCKTMTWQQFEVAKLNERDNCNLRTGIGRGAYGKKL